MELFYIHTLQQIVTAVVMFLLGSCVNFIRMNKKHSQAVKNGVCALLRNEILKSHHAAAKDGYISVENLENVTKMYNAYRDLGGNGIIEKVIREIRSIKISGGGK